MKRLAVLLVACGGGLGGSTTVPMPNGAAGVGFDDLRFSPKLGVLAPGGRTGSLFVVNPDSLAVDSISGFSAEPKYGGGHDFGPTSVDVAGSDLLVTDRTTKTLNVVQSKAVAFSIPLSGGPDYVRYAPSRNEAWITEPDSSQLEIISLDQKKSVATIPIDNGPESMEIMKGRAYVHRWQKSTLAIDIETRAIAEEWPNGCAASRGIAVDEAHGWVMAGCLEGTLSVLDANDHGKVLGAIARGSGFDVIGYSPALRHVYMVGFTCKCLVVIGLSSAGVPSLLDRFDTPGDGSCAVADDRGHAYACGTSDGTLHRYTDSHPALP